MTRRQRDVVEWAILAAAIVAAVVLILVAAGCAAPLPGYGTLR